MMNILTQSAEMPEVAELLVKLFSDHVRWRCNPMKKRTL